jgi:hypothetical protein
MPETAVEARIMITPSICYIQLLGAIIAAKWAMDLGFSQFRQLLWGIAGLVAAPLVLLIRQTPGTARTWY